MRHLLLIHIAWLILLFLKPISAYSQCSENEIINLKKTAIVFGERSYRYCGSLANPINDANDIADSLKKVGFDVLVYNDVSYQIMNNAVDSWCNNVKNYDVALFYFSGHGAEVKGENYLFPVDINPKGPSDLNYSAISAGKILERLDNSSLKYSIMILDACRSNPFTKSWSRDVGSKGLAAMSGKGAFIAFAASPGATALDGEKRNGIYTEGILKSITIPNLTIDQIFTRVNSYVRSNTSGDQVPFKNSSLGSDYCFSVSRKIIPVIKGKSSTFLQPASGILISDDQQRLFTVDTAADGLTIRDTKTLNIASNLSTGNGKTEVLSSRYNGNLYVADSANRRITIVDWNSNKILHTINLKYAPLGIVPSIDNNKLYVCGNYLEKGMVETFDLKTNKSINSLSLRNEVEKMATTSDLKFIYLSAESPLGFLTIVDTKSEKVIKEIPNIVTGTAIGITPDNKRLYTSSFDNSRIFVLDLITHKRLDTIDVKASSFAFTEDSKFVFALYYDRITMIKISDNEPISKLPFVTQPKGIALSNDGSAFVWLPQEKRVFMFQIKDQAENGNIEIDPETKLKKFKEEVNSDPTLVERIKKIDICRQINKLYFDYLMTVRFELLQELNINYVGVSGQSPSNCDKFIYAWEFGIALASDEKKSIFPTITFQYNDGNVLLTMKDDKIDRKAETFKFLLEDKYNNELKKFMRNYYINRLDHIRK